jgi:toxin FitB
MWNIIDSSAWLEFFGNTKNADHFSKIIEKNNKIIIPTIVLYEVFKLLLIKFDKSKAVEGIAQMKRSLVIDLNDDLALKAARISQKESYCKTTRSDNLDT